MIDYRKLLVRYIAHVTEHEGTSFLHSPDEWDAESWSELENLRDEAYANAAREKTIRRGRAYIAELIGKAREDNQT